MTRHENVCKIKDYIHIQRIDNAPSSVNIGGNSTTAEQIARYSKNNIPKVCIYPHLRAKTFKLVPYASLCQRS